MEQEQQTAQQAASDPEKLLAEGKRCLAASDPAGAVNNLQEACSLLAASHGQVSVELAEPYYLYGKALLELARTESAVLGSGIPVPEERASSDDEGGDPSNQTEGDSPSNENGDAAAENGEATKDEQPSTNEGSAPATNEATNTNEGSAPATDEGTNTNEGTAPATNEAGSSNSKDGGEDESDLQIAWQVLELARVICQKEDSNDFKLKLADVNLLLAEVGLESDQYDQAISDLQASLQLREFVLEATDRRLAEVHFSLGLAYTLANQLDSAIAAYKKSKVILVKRKELLEEQAKNSGDEGVKEEIKELDGLLPDIASKVTDVEVLKRVIAERLKEAAEQHQGGETPASGFGSSSDSNSNKAVKDAPAMDISHLVRKRTAEDTSSVQAAKRQCTEERKTESESNGDSTAPPAEQ